MNNALGAVLPLVQQLRAEIEGHLLDPEVAADDLRQIEHSIQVCRRIFGAMVHFARGSERNPSEVSLRHAVDVAFSNSPNNQDDITLLALDLAEPAAVHDGVMGV